MNEGDLMAKAASSATGSWLAVWMSKVVGFDRIFMFCGGFAASWFLNDIISEKMSLQTHQVAVGFALGFLSMLFLRKLFEAFESIDSKKVADSFVDKLRKFLGVEKK
jgi:hypothetical protein